MKDVRLGAPPVTDKEIMKKPAMEVELEKAMDLAGAGRYQVFHCGLMLCTLTAALMEIMGNAFVLPAAICDLHLTDGMRGIITSIPNIGIILTAALWGRIADRRGRRPALIAACAGAGLFGAAAAFMPTALGYALCKLAGSLFLACPTSLCFAYAGEMVPRRRRDLAILIVNGLMSVTTTFAPILAWIILSFDWHCFIASLDLRPWRVLSAVSAMTLILNALSMTQAKESPKFLMTKDKRDEALAVLRHVFVKNTGLKAEEYSVTSLKSQPSAIPENGSQAPLTDKAMGMSALDLLRPPHFKWIALTGFLMFGVFALLNGLFLFAPDTLNKVMRDTDLKEGTLCVLMGQSTAVNQTGQCVDTISHSSYMVITVTTAVYGVMVMLASICPVSKKTMLVITFGVTGLACLMSGVITNKIVAGTAMSALQLTALGVGPLQAYAVHLFPTALRGTAVGTVMMLGRIGAVAGANSSGHFLATACAPTFYGFTILLFLCAALSLLLPNGPTSADSPTEETR